MTPLRLSLVLAALICAACVSSTVPTDRRGSAEPPADGTFDSAEEIMAADLDAGLVPSVAYAVARASGVVHQGAFGGAATAETPYALASVTKPFVATAVAILAERGAVDLDAPVRAVLPDWFEGRDGGDFTVRQLLGHTAGLATYARIHFADRPTRVFGLAEAFERHGFEAQPPGTVYEYSNLGYGLLGEIVERASGRTLDRFLEEELFEPLGLTHSALRARPGSSLPVDAARPHDADGAPLSIPYNDTPGAGNLYASARDLARFGAFHLAADDEDADVLSLAGRRAMRQAPDPTVANPYYGPAWYGLGWYAWQRAGEPMVIWHEGEMPGASALLALVPELDLAVAVVIDASAANAHAQRYASALAGALEPTAPALSFDATEGLEALGDQVAGTWEGSIRMDGRELPMRLTFDDAGVGRAWLPSGADLPGEPTAFDSFWAAGVVVGAVPASLDGDDVVEPGLALLRLVRREDRLTGFAVAFATPARLEHLLPYQVELTRVKP
jgi:CubicO group peptidase (beta-lactamase class C family)